MVGDRELGGLEKSRKAQLGGSFARVASWSCGDLCQYGNLSHEAASW